MRIKDLCRKGGFSDATFYKWRAKYGGMDVPDAKWRELESKNAKLRKLLAEAHLAAMVDRTIDALQVLAPVCFPPDAEPHGLHS